MGKTDIFSHTDSESSTRNSPQQTHHNIRCHSTCCKLRQVFLLLGWIPKKQDALEADGLVGAQSDADAQVVTPDDLHQAGVLQGRISSSQDSAPLVFTETSGNVYY